MKRSLLTAVALVGSLVMSVTVNAQGNSKTNKGETPNGKPFIHLNEAIQGNADAINSLESVVQTVINDVNSITLDLDGLESLIQLNQVAISQLQVDLNATDTEVVNLQQQVDSNIADINADILLINGQIDGLQISISSLTAQLAQEMSALQLAIQDNSDGVAGLLVTVSSLTSQILLIDMQIDNHEGHIAALESGLSDLSSLVASLDVRLIAVEQGQHSHFDGLCFSLDNTANEDLIGNDWFDTCIEAAQNGGSTVRVVLEDASGNIVYDASGAIVGDWSQEYITSTSPVNIGSYGSQYHSSNHDRMISLDNGDNLMITSKYALNWGCGGSFGNGYGIVVYPSVPNYYSNPKMVVMPYKHQISDTGPRYFSGWTALNEISWNDDNSFNTCSSTPGFEGSFEFYVN